MSIDILPPGQAQILAIKTALASVSNWRCHVSQKYPDDRRNGKAAAILTALAAEPIGNVPDDLIAEIGKHHGLTEATKELASRIGFSLFPSSLTEFLYSILLHVAEQQKQIDRRFSKSEGAR